MMYFIFEMEFSSNKSYITQLLRAYRDKLGMKVDILQTSDMILFVFDKEDERIESFLVGLNEILPASIYFGKSKHYFTSNKPNVPDQSQPQLPVNISLCPTCQKEMFDVSSPRYYYPFTSCNACGGQHPFVTAYPYSRENSTMKFLTPCSSCKDELQHNVFRKDYPLISCTTCGITLRMKDADSEHYANDKGSYRKLFEVSAGAIAQGKSVLVKTLNGYRKFFLPTVETPLQKSILMINDANTLNRHLMMVSQEFNALLSIERPLVRVSTKSDLLKGLYGSTVLAKYPDDGMSMLLAKELLNLGLEYVAYIECDADTSCDFLVDFDIPVAPQKDSTIFINQDSKFFISGERVIYPAAIEVQKDMISVAHDLVAVNVDKRVLIDSVDSFDAVMTSQVNVLQDESYQSGHSNEKRFEQWEASMTSILAEHGALGEKAVGIHFDTSLYFLYYNGKRVINVIPPNPFEADNIFEHIGKLREGSERLVLNYKKAYPEIYSKLDALRGDVDIFSVTSMMLGLKDESLEGISSEALSFLGKGGIQIDTRVEDNRFDNYAFLASIMSYQLGSVDNALMCYSIYESFGDYIAEVVKQLTDKTSVQNVTFSGETLANQALYARIHRHMGNKNLLFPKNYPIGKECAVHGAIYI